MQELRKTSGICINVAARAYEMWSCKEQPASLYVIAKRLKISPVKLKSRIQSLKKYGYTRAEYKEAFNCIKPKVEL